MNNLKNHKMIKVITKDSPQKLIDKLNSYINSKSTSLWKIDEDGDYVLYTPDYQYKAWMTIEREYNKNTFNVCIIESKKNPMTKRIYSVYHCKFAEFLLEYFDCDIERVEITSMLVPEHDKYNKNIML